MKRFYCFALVLLLSVGCPQTDIPLYYLAEPEGQAFESFGTATRSPDGTKIVSAGSGRIVQIVDAESWEVLHTFSGHTDWVRSAQFSPDSKRIITASDDKTIRILDVDSGRELQRFAHTGEVIFAAFSPDERQIVTGNKDGIVRLWDTAMERELQRFEGHTDRVHYITFSFDGKKIATCSGDGTVRIWDVESGMELHKLEGLTSDYIAQFFPDGHGIIVVSNDGEDGFIWDFVEEME
jgi:WD40 repeat protein